MNRPFHIHIKIHSFRHTIKILTPPSWCTNILEKKDDGHAHLVYNITCTNSFAKPSKWVDLCLSHVSHLIQSETFLFRLKQSKLFLFPLFASSFILRHVVINLSLDKKKFPSPNSKDSCCDYLTCLLFTIL